MERSRSKRHKRLDSESPYKPPKKSLRSLATTPPKVIPLPELTGYSHPSSVTLTGNRLIVALDFGTTCSGAAWFFKESPGRSNVSLEEINSVTDWDLDPSERPYKRQDVPTEVQYDAGLLDHLYGEATKVRNLKAIFGFEIDSTTKDAGSIGHSVSSHPLRLAKLLLSEDPATASIRSRLRGAITELIAAGAIETEDDVIVHLFTYLLEHTFADICKASDIMPKVEHVEFAIGIPPAWTARGRRRELDALQRAIAATEFENRFQCSQNIFAIAETEAAATYLLHGKYAFKHLDAGAVVDIGGGTTDANVCRVLTQGSLDQLRLNEELVTSTGVVCGANSPNRELHDIALAMLKNESYLIKDGLTLESIVQSNIVRRFELSLKRKVDFNSSFYSRMEFYIQGLRAKSTDRRFRANHLILERSDVKRIFEPFIGQVKELIRKVVIKCQAREVEMTKMILVGGGSESIPVTDAIQEVLTQMAPQVKLLHNANRREQLAGFASNAVACGCLLRALDKEGGPKRFLDTNVGVIRHEHFEDSELHNQIDQDEKALPQPPDPLWIQTSDDGNDYVFDVVKILIPKGTLIDPATCVCDFESIFKFSRYESQWDCTEAIMASDDNSESGYPMGHPKNKGVDTVGTVTVNVEHLYELAQRKEGPLKWIRASGERREHYMITLRLRIFIQGLRMTAELCIPDVDGSKARTDLNITSMFKPGAT